MAPRRKPAKKRTARRRGARPFWSGTLSFGLVSMPVDVYPATRGARVSLRMLAPDGTPLVRRYTCPKDGRDVPADELVRGYPIEEDEYVVLTDEELEAADPKKTRDIDLRRFVDVGAIDPFLFENGYVLTPAGDTNKPYRLVAETMEREGKAGIATFVLRAKERLVAIFARDGILWAETLRFAGEVRSAANVGLGGRKKASGQQDAKAVAAFRRAIESLEKEAFDPEEFADARAQRLKERIERKARKATEVVESAAPEQADDVGQPAVEGDEDASGALFEAIRRSLKEGSRNGAASGGGRTRRSAKARRRTGARRR